jgi:general secretion pathway protein J
VREVKITCARHRGFTLIEVVVALTLFSLIMVATVTAFRTLASTQIAADRVTTRNDEMRAVSTFLRDAFESAVLGSNRSRTSAGGSRAERSVFELSAESLIWRTALLFGESAGGAYVVRVAREADELVLRWQQMGVYGELAPWSSVPSRTLVRGLQEFSVAYRPQYGDPWLADQTPSQTPRWVRLRLKASDRFWPDLIMQVAQ